MKLKILIMAIVLIAWIVTYIFNKKAILALPFLVMPYITPIYNYFDYKYLVKIFGCGCPNSGTLNIGLNANHLRFIVYLIIAFLMYALSIFLSRKLKTKKGMTTYRVLVLFFNLVLGYMIVRGYMWN